MSKQCTSAVPRDFPDDHLHHVPDHESRRYPAVQGAQLRHMGAHLWLQPADGIFWQMFYCGPLSRLIFRTLFKKQLAAQNTPTQGQK